MLAKGALEAPYNTLNTSNQWRLHENSVTIVFSVSSPLPSGYAHN